MGDITIIFTKIPSSFFRVWAQLEKIAMSLQISSAVYLIMK